MGVPQSRSGFVYLGSKSFECFNSSSIRGLGMST